MEEPSFKLNSEEDAGDVPLTFDEPKETSPTPVKSPIARKTSSAIQRRNTGDALAPLPDHRKSRTDQRVRTSEPSRGSSMTRDLASSKSLTQISLAIERRLKMNNPPKTFTIDSAKTASIHTNAAATSSSTSNSANVTMKRRKSAKTDDDDHVPVPAITDIYSSRGSHHSSTRQSQSSQDHVTGGVDREVSTSFSESLDELFEKSAFIARVNNEKRLSSLQEERSRPSSAINPGGEDYRPGVSPSASGIPSTYPIQEGFDDMNFVQYGSADIEYDNKQKSAKIIGKYVMGDVLGEGSYGKVKEGFCIETLKRVAIKIMRQSKLKKIPMGEQNVKREIAILKRLRHKNIADMMDVIYNKEKQKIYVVFEYCAGTLSDLLSRAHDKKLSLSQSQNYCAQLVHGMCYLHSHSVIHRDIKPGNLLLTFDDVIKISDFGVSEELNRYRPDNMIATSAGSPAFQPPEVAKGMDSFSGTKCDVWAVGVTLYNMVSGKLPFDGETIYALFENVAKGEFDMPIEADSILIDFLAGLLDVNSDTRLDMDAASGHTWLRLQLPKIGREVSVLTTWTRESTTSGGSEMVGYPAEKRGSDIGISNPNYAYDTTLIPYFEAMFPDVSSSVRRSSVTETTPPTDINNPTKGGLTEKFLRRMSMANVGSSEKVNEAGLAVTQNNKHTRKSSTASSSRPEGDKCKMQ